MPTFEITAPDGRKFRVSGPEGSTQEQALAQVQSRYQAQKPIDPTEGMSGGEKFLAGVGKGMTDVVRGVGQAVGLVPQSRIDEAKALDAPLVNTGAGMAGSIAGGIAATLPTALIPGAGTVAGAAAIGAGQGLLSPVASDESRLANVALGAGGGAAGAGLAKGLSRVAQPIQQSADVKALTSQGIIPTPGQAAGGFVKRIEGAIESLPLVGDIIKNAKVRATGELNLAALKRASPQVTAIGRQGLEQADDILSRGYDDVLSRINVRGDAGFRQSIQNATKTPTGFLTGEMEKNLNKLVKSRVLGRVNQQGVIPGELAKKIDSELGTIARQYSGSADAAQRSFGEAVREVQTAFRSGIEKGASGADAATLKELNRSWANLVRVQKATGYLGAKEGVFSAAQLQSAVRAADPTRNKGAFAKGNALMQDLSDPARRVMGDVVPDSGTAGRLLTAAGLTGAGVDAIFGSPGYLTALGASPLAYSRSGSRYLLGDYPTQAAIAEMIRGTSPYLGLAGRSVLLDQ